jgi:hypothetical protein
MTSSTARAHVLLAIATPVLGAFTPRYVQSLMETLSELQDLGVPTSWLNVTSVSLIGLARAQLAGMFLASTATHMLSIDADMTWSPADVLRLIEHSQPFVCGTYLAKDGSGRFQHLPKPGAVPCPRTGLVEIDGAPGGFTLVRRDVFDAIAAAGLAPKIVQGPSWNPTLPMRGFYDHGTDAHGRYVGEDIAFSAKWRSIGGRILLDPTIQLGHLGTYEHRGDPLTLFQAAPSEVAA